MRKGFLHIIEIVNSLDEKGINWLNNTQVLEGLETYFNGTNVIFNLLLKNAIKTPQVVGCICSPAEFDELKISLKSFLLNDENISYQLFRIEPPTIPNCATFTTTLPVIYDTIIMFDYNFSGHLGCFPNNPYNYDVDLSNYLSAGNGFVHIRNITKSNINGLSANLRTFRDFFGIKYDVTAGVGTGEGEFIPVPGDIAYKERKYFFNFPIYEDNFNDNVADDFNTVLGTWNVQNGELIGDRINPANFQGFTRYDGEIAEDYELDFDFHIVNNNPTSIVAGFWSPEYNSSSFKIYVGIIVNSNIFTANAVIFNEFVSIGSSAPLPLARVQETIHAKFVKKGTVVSLVIYNEAGQSESISLDLFILPFTSDKGFYYFSTNDFDQAHFDNFRLKVADDFSFGNFLSSQEQIRLADSVSEGSVLVRQIGSDIPMAVLNENLDVSTQKGRTAWISDGASGPEKDLLLRSIIAWASGDEYPIIKSKVQNPAVFTFFKTVQKDMFQPIEIVMNLGFVF